MLPSKIARTYTAQRGSIYGGDSDRNTHCVASTATDGSLHVWRIDLIQSSSLFRGTVDPSSCPTSSSARPRSTLLSHPVDHRHDSHLYWVRR